MTERFKIPEYENLYSEFLRVAIEHVLTKDAYISDEVHGLAEAMMEAVIKHLTEHNPCT